MKLQLGVYQPKGHESYFIASDAQDANRFTKDNYNTKAVQLSTTIDVCDNIAELLEPYQGERHHTTRNLSRTGPVYEVLRNEVIDDECSMKASGCEQRKIYFTPSAEHYMHMKANKAI